MFIGIIPARYASTRFPGKPLTDIHGKPMIQRVYEQAKKCNHLQDVIVATDDERIENAVKAFGGKVMMTSNHHQTGTERCQEVYAKVAAFYPANDPVVINIQGDEPYIHPEQIDSVCNCFVNEKVKIATLIMRLKNEEELFNANVIKAVKQQNGQMLYFSRNPVPFTRGLEKSEWLNKHTYYKHIGIYAYKASVLNEIVKLGPTPLEQAESLEQLRWLENGYTIFSAETTLESWSVDVPEDIHKLPTT